MPRGLTRRQSASNLQDVRHNRTRCGARTGPRSFKHHRTNRVSGDRHRVEHTLHSGHRIAGRDQCWMHAQIKAQGGLPGSCQHANRVTQLPSMDKVPGLQRANPLAIHIVRADLRMEGQRGEDRQLVRSVDPVNVARWISLGIPQVLRLSQGVVVAFPVPGHCRDHVVRRAVNYRPNGRHFVRLQITLQHPDDWDAAADARLVAQFPAASLRQLQELRTMLRHHLFVGRHHRLASRQRRPDAVGRRLLAAHQLHDDVDFVERGQRQRSIRNRQSRRRQAGARRDITHCCRADLKPPTATCFVGLGIGLQCVKDPAPDDAQAEQPNSQGVCH